MKYYLIAGERSGDLHGSNLIRGIREKDPQAVVRGWGGDFMVKEGMQLVTHIDQLSFMGFWEVAKNLGTIRRLLKKCQGDLWRFKPDALVLIDYPGFNLRMARFAKKLGIKVFYYISPKVWAWNSKRVYGIKASVDRMFVILPFEVDFYRNYKFKVDYVGNPIMDALSAFRPAPDFLRQNRLAGKRIIAVLPGSRKQEVQQMLSLMLSVHQKFESWHFVVAGVSNLPKEYYAKFEKIPNISLVIDSTYDLLHNAQAALVASGTATLETALLNVPQVVCYKTSPVSYRLAKWLIKVRFISLVNLIANKQIVRELIQKELILEKIDEELRKILPGNPARARMLEDYTALKEKVGGPGASARAGSLIVEDILA